MAKGKSARRREKNFIKANEGNLAKAQRGKASAFLPLPNAPKAEDFKERVPRSLKRIMALREDLEKQEARRRERQQQQQQRQQQQQAGGAAGGAPPAEQAGGGGGAQQGGTQGKKRPEREQQQAGEAQEPEGGPQKKRKKAAAAAAGGKQQPGGGGTPAGGLWEQPKTLKARKKEYLNKKKAKAKGKGQLPAHLVGVTEKELALRDVVRFGERVDAPPQVQLKRKNWVGGEGDTSKERCTKIFEQQMATAQRRMQEAGGKQQGGQHGQQQRPGKAQKQKQKHAVADPGVREAVIEAYRARHGTRPREGAADLDTLRKLAGAGGGAGTGAGAAGGKP
ncbi:MAG: hypothetical protein J3K34DRAFT_89605 [Monoraphidium minutum]|nr:MAG: hypothetical protein J3K34DRAFT_89605 [Monoraphidium minutum]